MEKVYIIRKVNYHYNENSMHVDSEIKTRLMESLHNWDDDVRFVVYKHFMAAVDGANRILRNIEYVYLTKMMPEGSIDNQYDLETSGEDSVTVVKHYNTYDFNLTIRITLKEVEVLDD